MTNRGGQNTSDLYLKAFIGFRLNTESESNTSWLLWRSRFDPLVARHTYSPLLVTMCRLDNFVHRAWCFWQQRQQELSSPAEHSATPRPQFGTVCRMKFAQAILLNASDRVCAHIFINLLLHN